ncbi:MAG: hypothetical protein AB7T49_10525 [Oligoflexales bacterium]
MKIKTIGSMLFALLVSASAPAAPVLDLGANHPTNFERDRARDRDRFVLQFDDEQFTGASTIRLKEEILDQYDIRPNQLRRADLDQVVVFAKSRRGNGRVSLQVGNRETRLYRVEGGNFGSDNFASYDRIILENPSRHGFSGGVWQLHFEGNIKIRQVIVRVDGGWRNLLLEGEE